MSAATPGGAPLARILHASDLHATAAGLLHGAIDPWSRLDALAEHLRARGLRPDAILLAGDLAERGNAAAYPLVREAIARLSARLDAPALALLGNHDDPAAARAALPQLAAGPVRVRDIGGARLILIDTPRGEAGSEALELLAAALAAPCPEAPLGAVVVLHHPPVPSPLPVLAGAELADAPALRAVLREATLPVRAILAGHFHHALSALLDGIPVHVGPALAYRQQMDAGPGTVVGLDRGGYALLELDPDAVRWHAVELEHPAPVFTLAVPGRGASAPLAPPPGPGAPAARPGPPNPSSARIPIARTEPRMETS